MFIHPHVQIGAYVQLNVYLFALLKFHLNLHINVHIKVIMFA